ncbi:SM-20 [Marinicella pacifica]|uniref:SM-20 n=1 Tax=Marinicella pacifica TaxID=1171543 RepID=A0A917CS38_9GAMM|nr:2OG-Fe(II) oxygenase [Marinicella pacifica]GGF94600.1 SM-20 [Marinicella pacifica]
MGLFSTLSPQAASQLDVIVSGLYSTGFVVLDHVFDDNYLTCLLKELIDLNPQEFKPAGIGREDAYQKNKFVRNDRIHWLDGDESFLSSYLTWAESLRLAVNRRLFLGLYEYECMFAHYPEGAFYKRHIDAFKTGINRRLSTVLYLNPQWGPQDGGELVMYAPDSNRITHQILPTMGRLVVFLSEEFPHEVLPAKRARYSLTGWYRINEGHHPAF